MARLVAIVIAILVALVLIGKCSRSDQDPAPSTESLPVDNSPAPPVAEPTRQSSSEGEPISVPSDSRASYHLISWRRLPNGHLESLSRRDGPSGVDYARREIDCDAMTFRYLGEGDTPQEAKADSPNLGDMAELTPESISTYVSQFTCAKAGK